jgi:hypothetical protein
MIRICGLTALLMVCSTAAVAEIILQDNYLGNPTEPGWAFPYDGVAAQSSERRTIVSESWAGDDIVVPVGIEYKIQRLSWIGVLLTGPGAVWETVDVIILPRNPVEERGRPIAPGTMPVAEFTNIPMDEFAQRTGESGGETLWGLPVYEGSVTVPEVTLPAGHYYFAVRVVGNNRGQHFMLTTGGGVDFGAGEMGVMQSSFFFQPEWIDIVDYLKIPDPDDPSKRIPYATDFAYRVYGEVVPEPASIALLMLGAVVLRLRRS